MFPHQSDEMSQISLYIIVYHATYQKVKQKEPQVSKSDHKAGFLELSRKVAKDEEKVAGVRRRSRKVRSFAKQSQIVYYCPRHQSSKTYFCPHCKCLVCQMKMTQLLGVSAFKKQEKWFLHQSRAGKTSCFSLFFSGGRGVTQF